jgi:hypothetical protein
MGRPKGQIALIAEAAEVDTATVRRALVSAGKTAEDISVADGVALVNSMADPARIVGHQATRVTSNPAMADARARHEQLKAEELEIKLAKARGELIDRKVYTETGIRILSEVRTALLSLGFRIAPKVVGNADEKEIARVVEAEVRDVLGVLADDARFFKAMEDEALT